MTARDELAELIWEDAAADRVKDGSRAALVPVVRSKVEALADAILAAGYSKPRVITTVEALNALPTDSVIRSGRYILEKFAGEWYMPGAADKFRAIPNWLPATVLHEGSTK